MQGAIARLLISIGEGENKVETQRQIVSSQPSFTAKSVFEAITLGRKSVISERDLLDFFDSLDVYATEKEAELVIAQYDSDHDRCMSCTDFSQMTLPATSPHLRASVLRRLPIPCHPDLCPFLTHLITQELQYHRQLLADIRHILTLPDFNIYSAFDSISQGHFITKKTMSDALTLAGYSPENEVLDAVFRRLGWSGEEKLSLEEFAAPFELISQENSPVSRTYSQKSATFSRKSSAFSGISPIINAENGHKTANFSIKTVSFSKKSPIYSIPLPQLESLLAYFKEKLAFFRESERSCQALALDPGFTMEAVYHLFDPTDKGSLGPAEIEDGLRGLGISVSPRDARLVLREYSTSSSLKLLFCDFCDMVLPYSLSLHPAPSPLSPKEPLQPPTSDHVSDLFRLLVSTERRLEAHRQELSRLSTFSLSDLFASLVINSSRTLTLSNMRDFLEYHSIPTSESELTALLAWLDRNKDGEVTRSEFISSLAPREP